MDTSQFKIYNASAGSGKTFTLVKEYLKLLFISTDKEHFKHILAITFTNKAAGEMKERIIDTLKQFSNIDILQNPNNMFLTICNELPIEQNILHQKSKNTLQTIIHNYAAFDISTIDGFTHRVIRTFAHDLKLPLNFEVELDTDSLLREAVDKLIAKAGTNKELTQILIDFSIEKADDDKSWDISFDFNKIAKLLVKENDIPYLNTLKDKTLYDFKVLKSQLKRNLYVTEEEIVKQAQSVLTLINECGLQFEDFSRSSLPNHFKNLTNKNFKIKFDSNWQTDLLENNTLFPKRVTNEIASIINEIQPQIVTVFNNTKEAVLKHKFLTTFYKNITPLSILNSLNIELSEIKEEQNKLLISEFNSLISNEIKDQPTPFIYERLGEKFKHYFIDEFQDTSRLQWQNLIPLIDNSLSSTFGSAMLVGDAKQAIYRWRGGEAEQFINLYNKTTNPFQIKQQIKFLKTNYRSAKAIVNFNNSFFQFLSQTAFSNTNHSSLYKHAHQSKFNTLEGFVNLTFLETEKDDDLDELYALKVLETILSCQKNGYQLSDLCILIRKKKHGFALAQYLSDNKINIISSETLLIKRSSDVMFINNLFEILVKPSNLEVKIVVLNYIADKFNIENKHTYFKNHLNQDLSDFFLSLKEFGVDFYYSELIQLSLFDLAESIVRTFKLVNGSNAYIQFYLDFILDYSQKNKANITDFLDHFENKKDTLSIVSPEGQNAVRIMTIHKSKGLEFPVVIFPYANLDIYEDIEPKEWLPIDPEKYNGFSHALLNYSKDFAEFGETAEVINNNHQSGLELDSLNLLYVTLTRPIDQLYIISKKEVNKNGEANLKKFSGLFINYLKEIKLWDDAQLEYIFGEKQKAILIKDSNANIIEQQFISTNIKDHNVKIVTKSALLWDTKQEKAIEKGNLLHHLLATIKTSNDIEFSINDFIKSNIINSLQAKELKEIILSIVNHQQLAMYFNSKDTIYNEKEITTNNGVIYIPDKIIINSKNEAVIIDYKTGVESNKHIIQLETYKQLIEDMNIKVVKKILVYINDAIQIKEF